LYKPDSVSGTCLDQPRSGHYEVEERAQEGKEEHKNRPHLIGLAKLGLDALLEADGGRMGPMTASSAKRSIMSAPGGYRCSRTRRPSSIGRTVVWCPVL
jgi:hypothetical protein